MSKKAKGLEHTYQVRLYPTHEQSRMLMAHCQEYIDTVNVLVHALDADTIPHDDAFSTKDFRASLPSAVKNQALRDAKSVFSRSLDLGTLPVLKKPICQWNNQNWSIKNAVLLLPVCQEGKIQQIEIACATLELVGLPGMLRIKKKRGKWIVDITMTQAKPAQTDGQNVMGIDLGIKVPAAVYVLGYGAKFFGNGRSQRAKRRMFYSQRKELQKAKKTRALKEREHKESRWMKAINHTLSRQIVNHAIASGVGTIKGEELSGVRQGTTRTSRGAKARKNNRMKNTWSFYQLTMFIAYKATRAGIRVEKVDPAYTSQECPACTQRNKADDRTYVCVACGWYGHRDMVGSVNISRRTGLVGQRQGATRANSSARRRAA